MHIVRASSNTGPSDTHWHALPGQTSASLHHRHYHMLPASCSVVCISYREVLTVLTTGRRHLAAQSSVSDVGNDNALALSRTEQLMGNTALVTA